MSSKSLVRTENDKIVAGVCGGLARFFGIPSKWVRIGWIVFMLLGGSGVLVYLILWLLMPGSYR